MFSFKIPFAIAIAQFLSSASAQTFENIITTLVSSINATLTVTPTFTDWTTISSTVITSSTFPPVVLTHTEAYKHTYTIYPDPIYSTVTINISRTETSYTHSLTTVFFTLSTPCTIASKTGTSTSTSKTTVSSSTKTPSTTRKSTVSGIHALNRLIPALDGLVQIRGPNKFVAAPPTVTLTSYAVSTFVVTETSSTVTLVLKSTTDILSTKTVEPNPATHTEFVLLPQVTVTAAVLNLSKDAFLYFTATTTSTEKWTLTAWVTPTPTRCRDVATSTTSTAGIALGTSPA